MCTVVCRWLPGEPVRLLALRDEFIGRDFDDPDTWWPEQPTAIGGRDRTAGGTWCASDHVSGTTALVVNRIERLEGTPSRGILPLAALAHGENWPDRVDPSTMASFNLVLARPDGVTAWSWDATELRRVELDPGPHMITSRGLDADDAKTQRFAPIFAATSWPAVLDVVTDCEPSDQESALVVRREIEIGTYATVFGQLITSTPGALQISYSRTPWVAGSWTTRDWPAEKL